MALVKCPDCGKMVSERALVCPECGCPRQYFILDQKENIALASNAQTTIVSGRAEKEVKKENSVPSRKIWETFTVLGKTITYYEDQKDYILAARSHAKCLPEVEKEIRRLYESAKDIDIVWDEISPFVQRVINQNVHEIVTNLYQNNIMMTEDEFKRKYALKYFDYLKPLADEYDVFIHASNILQQQREYERSGRSRWEGGGFGLKGAIKGAVKAGALNMVTDVGRSIGDSIVDSGDKAALESDKKRMLEKKEENLSLLINSMRWCISSADIGHAEELAAHKRTVGLKLNPKQTLDNYMAAVQYEQDNQKLAAKSFSLLEQYPYLLQAYEMVFRKILAKPEELDEFMRFIQFWKLDFEFHTLFENVKKRDEVMRMIEKNVGYQNLDFKDITPKNYQKVKEFKQKIDQIVDNEEIEKMIPVCEKLKLYIGTILSSRSSFGAISYLSDITEESSIEEILEEINEEKEFLQEFFKKIWVKGDSKKIPEEKIKKKWKLPETDTIYLYQNGAIFGTAFGGDGFVLTNSLVCDLKSKKIICLDQLKSVLPDMEKYHITLSDAEGSIEIDLKSERMATLNFLPVFLERVQTDYIEEAAKRKEAQTVMTENIEMEEKTAKTEMFCPYCGKQILRTAKFCTYCGKSNNYGGNVK